MYSNKAFEILSSSISSAVFIDEKAKDFFSETPVNTEIVEEQLSIDLFNTFKENGKSLAVHRFEKKNLEDSKIIDYLFSGRDLILLDWELDKITGQEYSLQLLSKSIELPYINFCCIYSRSTNFNQIPLFLTTYFSGLTKDDFDVLKNNYEYLTVEEIQDFWNKPESNVDIFFNDNKIDLENLPLENLRDKSEEDILRYIYIALESDKYFIEENRINYEVIHFDEDSFIINNTFVLVLKKESASDKCYEKLIRRISDIIVKNKSSFFQLLGLEMQTVFNTNERFIDDIILKSSTEALFSFRNHINDDKVFEILIKKLLIEQASLKFRTAKLELLDSKFLDNHEQSLSNSVSTDDLMQLNIFYNAVSVKNLNDLDIANLNFGDIFKDETDCYYLCITALCDCYYPQKIGHDFYFVQGKEFDDLKLALSLGDTAFLSFLPNGKAVYWGEKEKPKLEKIKNMNLFNSVNDIKKMKNDIDLLKNENSKLTENQKVLVRFLYKPFYIKPKVYYVKENKLINNKIEISHFTKKPIDGKSNQDNILAEYITTLRNNYVQRIANHAFGHPARVGVDFIKL